MPRARISDEQLQAYLHAGKSPTEIAHIADQTQRNIERRIVVLGAKNAGAATRASDRIVQGGLDQAKIYYLQMTIALDRVIALAEACEEWEEEQRALRQAIFDINERQADNELFGRDFQKRLAKALDRPDPHIMLAKFMEVTNKNQQLYVNMHAFMLDHKTMNELKEALVSLSRLGVPEVDAIISAHIEESRRIRSFAGIDRKHPTLDATTWDADTRAAFATLPDPRFLPRVEDVVEGRIVPLRPPGGGEGDR